jgi:hypothetical protein
VRGAGHELRLLAATALASAPPLYLLYRFLGDVRAALVVSAAALAMGSLRWAGWIGIGPAPARELFVGLLYLLKLWLALRFGGLAAPGVSWFLLCPLVAMLLGGPGPGLAWGALAAAALAGLFLAERIGLLAAPYPVADPLLLRLASDLGLFALATLVALLACRRQAQPVPLAR